MSARWRFASALGAGRGRLVRQLLIESLTLAAAGGLLGLLVTMWGVDLLPSVLEARLPRADGIRMDGAVLAFSACATLVTGLFFGLAPALQAARPGRITQGRRARRRGTLAAGGCVEAIASSKSRWPWWCSSAPACSCAASSRLSGAMPDSRLPTCSRSTCNSSRCPIRHPACRWRGPSLTDWRSCPALKRPAPRRASRPSHRSAAPASPSKVER